MNRMLSARSHARFLVALLVSLAIGVSGCGGDGKKKHKGYTVGGTLSGLVTGQSVTLKNNDADPLTLSANGAFTFATKVAAGGGYSVTVGTQPTGGTCTVTNGAGSNVASNVTTVTVVCTASTYTIGGTLSGLPAGKSVTLKNNNADPLTLSADGAFTFAAPVVWGGSYAVTVGTQPTGATCTVTNGAGSSVTSDVNAVTVACSTAAYTIGGTLSGLAGGQTVTLKNNNADPLVLNANGPFAFATHIAQGGGYAVTVATQPTGQTCTVTNGSGTVAAANVTNVGVSCVSSGGSYTTMTVYPLGSSATDPVDPATTLLEGSDGNFYGTSYNGGANGTGTIFKFDPASGTTTVLASFGTGSEGQQPVGGLVQCGAYFCGVTSSGGTNGYGTVFRFNPASGIVTVLHNFAGQPTDGYSPQAGLVLSGTTLYGTTVRGGQWGYGAVFKYELTTDTYAVVHSFTGATSNDTAGDAPSGLILNTYGGYLYGITQSGGTYDDGVIYQIKLPGETVTVLHHFNRYAAVAEGAWPFGESLLQGSLNILYGTTTRGGSANNGTIYSFDLSTSTLTVLHSLAPITSEGGYPQGSMVSIGGYLYGTAYAGGSSTYGVLYKLALATNVYTVIHAFGNGPLDGIHPNGLMLGSDNKLYGTTAQGGGASNPGTIFVLQ